MSTVDTMLLLVSAAIIKDLYIRYSLKNDASRISPKKLARMSFGCTVAAGLLVFAASFNPPELLVWINLFAFGGLEAVFLWPIILGLYWKRANAAGAVFSILIGLTVFIFLSVFKVPLGGVHAIIPTLAFSFVAFVAGTHFGEPVSPEIRRLFWDEE